MKTHPDHSPLTSAALALGLALGLASAGALAGPGTQTEDDVYVGKKRQVQGVTSPTAATPKPLLPGGTAPNTGLSSAPVSATPTKTPMPGVTTPGTAAPQPRPGAGVSPNTAASAKKKTALTGGDDDLDDLEVERRKVQGVNTPGTTNPQLRPGAGTSPNTGRSAGPLPPVPPGK